MGACKRADFTICPVVSQWEFILCGWIQIGNQQYQIWAGGWSGGTGFWLLVRFDPLMPEFNNVLSQDTAWGS